MPSVDRHRLRFGPYKTPRFCYGQRVECEVRGEVIIAGLKDAPLPWPVAHLPGMSPRGLVIYKGLAKALRLESATAVCYHWRVTPQTVTRWRNQLGIGPYTDGNRELRREYGKLNFPKVKAKLWAKLHDPERAEKIAAAKRGKPRPPHVVEAMRKAARRRASEARAKKPLPVKHSRANGWTAAEDAIVRSHSTAEAVKRTGRTVAAVRNRRRLLGVPNGCNLWSSAEDSIIRARPIDEAVTLTGRTYAAVLNRRFQLGVLSRRPRSL